MSGINAIMSYSTKIFGFVGVDNDIIATLAVGAVNVATTILSVYLIDRLGRKTLYLGGTCLEFLSLVVLCGVLLGLNDSPGAQGNLAVVFVLLYVIGFAIGMGAVTWVIMAEILPNRVRSKAMSVMIAVSWASNLLISQFTLTVIEALGSSAGGSEDDQQKQGVAYLFGIFGAIVFCCLIFFATMVPETKGIKMIGAGGDDEGDDKQHLIDDMSDDHYGGYGDTEADWS